MSQVTQIPNIRVKKSTQVESIKQEMCENIIASERMQIEHEDLRRLCEKFEIEMEKMSESTDVALFFCSFH